ncbi:MAG: TrkA family potassium uptake protein [Muribaculaceae bacterium]|nr:TrkA family potassium uptake protein [Muribaculaceae bacterium]
MRYIVIGLGIYGANLARDLVQQGHEVIGADSSHATIEAIKDYITTAYTLDTTEESALSVLPLGNVDVVIVAIGENFGASVRTVALLKKAGVKTIYARAIDELHESILESFKVARILRPEQRAALDLTHEMAFGADVNAMRVTARDYVLNFAVPEFFVGMKYRSLKLESDYQLQLITVTRPTEATNMLGLNHTELRPIPADDIPETEIKPGDILTVYGTLKAFRTFARHIG